MRKILLMAAIALSAQMLVCAVAGAADAAGKTLTMGLLFADGYGADANFKGIVTDGLNNLAKQEGVEMKYEWFTEVDKFMKAVKEKKLDITYVNKHDILPDMFEKHGFKAFMTLSFVGDKANPICLFARADSKFRKKEDMRGARVATYYSREGYYHLRHIFGEKPDKFFSELIPKQKGRDALDMVAENKVDAAFVLRSNLGAMEITNPATAKKIGTIACTADYYDLPFMATSAVPETLLEKVKKVLANAHKDPAFKKFWSVMKTFKLKFVPVKTEDYKILVDIYRKGEKSGWEQEYQAWYGKVKGGK